MLLQARERYSRCGEAAYGHVVADDHHAELADNDAHLQLPAGPFIGLTVQEAEERAGKEGRFIRVLQFLEGPRRLDLAYRRVNIVLDTSRIVSAADAG